MIDTSYRLTLNLDGAPPLNSADNQHWRKRNKIKKAWHQLVDYETRQSGKPKNPLTAARIVITRISRIPPDGDNLHAAAKFILDGLQHAKVIANDDHLTVGMPDVRWCKGVKLRTLVHVMGCAPEDLDILAWDHFPPADEDDHFSQVEGSYLQEPPVEEEWLDILDLDKGDEMGISTDPSTKG